MEILAPGSGRRYHADDDLDHRAPLVFTVADLLGAAERGALITRIEAMGPEAAPITTAFGFAMRPDIRNNTRVMFDDEVLAGALFGRLAGALPAQLCDRRVVGVNERFRCYRYEPGQRFAPHFDGAYVRSATERSELTLMVYLNDGFDGGTTRFHDLGVEVAPRAGTALVFQHRLLHEGCVIRSGTKYVLRSDVMYAA